MPLAKRMIKWNKNRLIRQVDSSGVVVEKLRDGSPNQSFTDDCCPGLGFNFAGDCSIK
jgi:hypothetical protein